MAFKQGFVVINNDPYVYMENDIGNTVSAAMGINSAGAGGSGTFGLTIIPNPGASPDLAIESMTINPASGDIRFNPAPGKVIIGDGFGSGKLIVDTLTAYSVVCGGTASDTGPLQSVATLGSSGQVLTSNGAGALPTWQASSSHLGTTNHAVQVGNSTGGLTSLTVGTNGQVLLGSTGADPVFATLTSTGGTVTFTTGAGTLNLEVSETIAYTAVNHAASPYTVLAADYYISCDVTAGVITINLPNAPTANRTFIIKDKVGLAATSNITVTTVGGAVNIDGATTFVMNTAYQSIQLIFNSVSYEIY